MTMELTTEQKREIINKVQKRIDRWIGRDYMFGREIIALKVKGYPFKLPIAVDIPFLGRSSDINYGILYPLIRTTNVEAEEEKLFRYAVDNFLTYCFGG